MGAAFDNAAGYVCAFFYESGARVCKRFYDNLTYELKNSLHEYYRVNSLENYDEVYRAVAFRLENSLLP